MLSLRITELRKQKGLTQADISRHLHITQQTYSSYETGRRQINYETLCMLADYYEVSVDYLLGRDVSLPSYLNEEERNIIAQYRELGNNAKDAVKNCLLFEYSRSLKRKQ